jgi:flagellar protein FlaI
MHGLLYRVIEPELNEEEQKQLTKIENTLVEELEVDFSALKKTNAQKYLADKVNNVIEYYAMKMTPRAREVMDYYIQRDFVGLASVNPMFQDPNIEDISCDGTEIPIYVYHRDPRLGSIRSTVNFPKEEDLNSFVMKLAQRCGRSISVADPLLDGALPDGSRIQATFGTGISMKGSNFTIRKFTKDPLTFVDLVKYGTISAEMLAYIWLAVEHNKSFLIAGPTASGKTTLLNALSLFIRPELKIVSIEDTPELRLPHENWISQVARTGFGPEGASGKKLGEISLFDLLKASLRQRPDEIIVGEVRGKEAYVLFQQIATGHPGISTIHAESMEAVINRLTTPPIELPASLIQHLNILLVMTRQRRQGKYVRRIKDTVEVTGFDVQADRPFVNKAYSWDPVDDKFSYNGKSGVLKDIMEKLGTNPEGIFSEINRRVKVIEWLVNSGIRDFKNVGKVVSEYYQSPDAVLDRIT